MKKLFKLINHQDNQFEFVQLYYNEINYIKKRKKDK